MTFANYIALTDHCRSQICRCLDLAQGEEGAYARALRERAAGIYTGWRALVMDGAEPACFVGDDGEFRLLLQTSQH